MTRQTAEPKNRFLGVRLDEATMIELDKLAAKERRKTSEYVRLLIEDKIKETRKEQK